MADASATPVRRYTKENVRALALGRSSALGWALTVERYAILLDQIDFVIEEEDELNACARIRRNDRRREIEINTGSCGVLQHAIDAAMTLSGLAHLPAPRHGPVRQKDLLLGACLDFIVWHEVQHHGLGHVGYFHGPGDPGFAERGTGDPDSSSMRPLTSLDRRACELSADGEAASFLWRHQEALRSDRLSRYHGLARREMLAVASLASALVFASIAAGEPAMHLYDVGRDVQGRESEEIAERSRHYPHPCLRVMHAHAQFRPPSRWKARGDLRVTSRSLGIAAALSRAGVFTFDLFRPLYEEESYLLVNSKATMDHWALISERVETEGLWKRRC